MNQKHFVRLFTLLLFLTAAVLRIHLAMKPGLWSDEIFSLAMATGHSLEHPAANANPLLGDFVEPQKAQSPDAFRRYMQHETPPLGPRRVIRAVMLSDTSPPLYYLLLNLWTRVTGTSDPALRLFSALWALASFPFLWKVAQRIGPATTVWTACILYAFSPRAIYYSCEGRMYSMVWFFAIALIWYTFAIARRRLHYLHLLIWSLIGALGLLTHYFFAFVWLGCLGWLSLYRGKLSRFHLSLAASLTVLAVLPWYLQIPESLGRWRITGGWLKVPLSWEQAISSPFFLAWSLLSGQGPWGGSRWLDMLAAGLFGVLGLSILRYRRWRIFSGERSVLWICLIAACLGPVLFDLVLGTFASTIPRYALAVLPVAMLLAALGMTGFSRKSSAIFLLLILAAWLPGIGSLYSGPARPYDPYPSMASRLESLNPAAELVIVHSIPSGVLGVARYMESETPIASWIVQLERRRIPEDLYSLIAPHRYVALLKVHDMNQPSPAEAWLREHAMIEEHNVWQTPSTRKRWPKSELLLFSPGKEKSFF